MPNPYPSALRERAVRAYEAGEGSYAALADRYEVSLSSLLRVGDAGAHHGRGEPASARRGLAVARGSSMLEQVMADQPDATCEELRRAYNRRVGRGATVSRSAIVRAWHRLDFVLKKSARAPAKWTAPMPAGNGRRS